MNNEILTIGIAGGTASGKSSIAQTIATHFSEYVTHLNFDNYYKAHHEISFEERQKLNYDCPDAFELELLIEHVKQLQEGKAVDCPVYDFTVHDRSDKTVHVEPNKILMIEGIFALYDERVRDLMDTKVYVDVEADRRFIRRLVRDIKERGRSMENVIEQYLDTVRPMHAKYVEPTKHNADIIIPDGSYNKIAINVLIGHIRHYTNNWDLSKAFGPETFE